MGDPAAQVDYDALAQKHGGAVALDYDALAAKYGGSAAPLEKDEYGYDITPDYKTSLPPDAQIKRNGVWTPVRRSSLSPEERFQAMDYAPDDPNFAKHTYEGAKAGAMTATAPMALGATLPQLVGGAVGGTIGGVAGRKIAEKAGAGELGQEIGGDVGGLAGGAAGSGAADWSAKTVASIYKALPQALREEFMGLISPRIPHAIKLAGGLREMLTPETPAVYPGAPLPENPGQLTLKPTYPGAPLPANPGQLTLKPVYPGAPEPVIPPELRQAVGLREGGKPAIDPAAGLGKLPAHAVHQAIQELGPKATIEAVTERASNIAKLGDLLNDSLGGKGLEPNVPLKNQGGVVTPKTNGSPAGHTPVESSALKSYKYDPATREFESVTRGGQHYIYGDVPPEAAAKFEAADSKGQAWGELRKTPGVVQVAKVVNGKRVPTRPVLSEEDAIPQDEWEAGHELDTAVEGSPR